MHPLTQKTLTRLPLQNSNGLLSTAQAIRLALVVGLICFLVIMSNPAGLSRFLSFRSSPNGHGNLKWQLVRSSSFSHAAALDQVVLTGNGEGWALTWAELDKVQDNGKTWTPVLSNDQPGRKLSAFYSFTFTSPKTAFVVGTQEKGSGYTVLILKTTDGGDTWEERPTDVRLESDHNLSPRLQSVSFCNQKTGWAVGGDLILHTTDGGESWQQQQSYFNNDQMLFTVACVSPERALAVGTGGLLLQTTNAGDTWTHQDLGTKELLARVRFFGNNGWIVGGALHKDLLFRSHDGGNSWTPQKLNPSTGLLFDIFFLGSKGWIAAENGTLLRSEDGGETWARQEVPTTESLTSLFFLSPTQGWIGGDRLTLLRLSSAEAELNEGPVSGTRRLETRNIGFANFAKLNSNRGGPERPSFSSVHQTGMIAPVECDFSAYEPARMSHFAQTAAIRKLKPQYPHQAISRGIQGQVQVKILVNSDGIVEKACASGGDELLRKAAEVVTLQWRFKRNFGFSPSARNSKIKRYVEDFIVYNFTLNTDHKDASIGLIVTP